MSTAAPPASTTPPAAVALHAEPALPSLASTLRHVALVQEILKNVMRNGTHYGASFPGDQKKNLLKPGADALALAFRLVPDFALAERDLGHDHREFQVTCRLLTQATGTLIATGVGSCSTKESKYRYRNEKPKCPSCGQATVIKTKRGYWCAPDKGGCGANPEAADIESQPRGKTENPDIADVYNTVLKIAKKRAYVDATITATAASDLFTQDLEDLEGVIGREEARADKAAPQPSALKPATPPAATTVDAAEVQTKATAAFKGLQAKHPRLAAGLWAAAKAWEERLAALIEADHALTTAAQHMGPDRACEWIDEVIKGWPEGPKPKPTPEQGREALATITNITAVAATATVPE
jgi:ribosomal protein L37AE/L43A